VLLLDAGSEPIPHPDVGAKNRSYLNSRQSGPYLKAGLFSPGILRGIHGNEPHPLGGSGVGQRYTRNANGSIDVCATGRSYISGRIGLRFFLDLLKLRRSENGSVWREQLNAGNQKLDGKW
jgi:hypothetical protein